MYQELLERVAGEQRRFGDQSLPPCTDEQLRRLKLRAQEELGAELPAGYIDFLRRTNGLDWNGVVIYASETLPIPGYDDRFIEGVMEVNLSYRDNEWFQDRVVFGSDGMDIYTYEVTTGEYQIYDEVPHNLIETVSSFDELMARALTRSLT